MKGLSKESKILCTSIAIAILLFALGLISKDPGVLGNLIIIAVFIILVPQFLVRYRKFREIRNMESRFPAFLRDLTESLTAGLPLHKALI